ncbi:flotillin-like FloA family protein [Saccharicrinis sp. FJH62]|uniref:flotillin-like FloA family protein n=1 Tax=Saccharicrinis sp. FJH62 TaxID=3344657 RepID=UPI0035D4FCD6
MDEFLILIIVLGLLGTIILIPATITWLRANQLGAKINLSQAFGFMMRKTNKKDFFNGIAGFQKNKINVTLQYLEAHFLAGGNLLNCLNGYLYAKKNGLDIDFQIISAIDLAGKDSIEALKDSNKEYYLRIDNLKNKTLSLDYSGKYKYVFPSVFIDKDEMKIKNKITEKLQKFLDSWQNDNPLDTEKMILENILNTEFWEGNLRITILKQDFTIRKK